VSDLEVRASATAEAAEEEPEVVAAEDDDVGASVRR